MDTLRWTPIDIFILGRFGIDGIFTRWEKITRSTRVYAVDLQMMEQQEWTPEEVTQFMFQGQTYLEVNNKTFFEMMNGNIATPTPARNKTDEFPGMIFLEAVNLVKGSTLKLVMFGPVGRTAGLRLHALINTKGKKSQSRRRLAR
jgi:hypothetical protein